MVSEISECFQRFYYFEFCYFLKHLNYATPFL